MERPRAPKKQSLSVCLLVVLAASCSTVTPQPSEHRPAKRRLKVEWGRAEDVGPSASETDGAPILRVTVPRKASQAAKVRNGSTSKEEEDGTLELDGGDGATRPPHGD